MKPFLKGALVEYQVKNGHKEILSEIIFQFNPEKIQRSFQIPNRPSGADAKDAAQAGQDPIEKITMTIYFNASDFLNQKDPLGFAFGVSPQLTLLEKYARPLPNSIISSGVHPDKVVEAAAKTSGKDTPPANSPRAEYPRLIFVWGPTRILPVVVESLTINELQFDARLNPIQAEANVGLSVILNPDKDDSVANGALQYTTMKNQIQINAFQRVAQGVTRVVDLFKF